MNKLYGFAVQGFDGNKGVITTLYESTETAEENREEIEKHYAWVELIEFDIQKDDR